MTRLVGGLRASPRSRHRAPAPRARPLGPDDLGTLATAAFLSGRFDEAVAALERAQRDRVERGYLMMPAVQGVLARDDTDAAYSSRRRGAAEISLALKVAVGTKPQA